ncbi:LuxR family transcriptional regulator [Roseovarius sp. EL26]|uniref:helix-turn-helix transcriptional regulator n=1 Tax=Roseovarius sp. EL26 TaxID=2126672 RepID=UPI0013C4BBED|nr:LuxR family transcriptional regulator [Roseovarius sp. EL26]
MDNALIDLLNKLDHRSGEGAAYAITTDFFQGLGFRYVNIGLASTTDIGVLGMYSNMSMDWLSHYVDVGYSGCDVMFDYAMASSELRLCDPKSNLTLPSRDKARSDRMLVEVQDEGLVSSLILPRHSAVSDHKIGFNLCADIEGYELERMTQDQCNSILLGAALTQNAIIEDVEGDKYGAHWFPFNTDQVKLSLREAEVIKWLSEGLRNDRIADRLKISNATVNFHITSAKKKLGAKTREQAVAIALINKLI